MEDKKSNNDTTQEFEFDKEKTFQLDCAIPLGEQRRYFLVSQSIRREQNNLDTKALNQMEEEMYKKETSNVRIRYILTKLAASAQIPAYRMLEDFLIVSPPHLRNWALIAEFDCRIALQASLMGQTSVTVISSGLGGHNGLMRFMLLIGQREWKPLSDFQKTLMEKEFVYTTKENKGKVEEIFFGEEYMLMTFLLPLGEIPDPIFRSTVHLCNEFGSFLSTNHLFITNVSRIQPAQIEQLKEKFAQKKQEQ